MTDAAAVKEAINKVEQSIDALSEEMKATRKAMEELSQNIQAQMDHTVKQANASAQEIHRDIETFREQRQLVETQLIAEVDRAKELSNLKDIEDAVRVIIEVVDELTNRINLDDVVDAVKKLEASKKGGA
jgi:predicted ribonuclease toxin of YeeF-YezG toxin-antitoxin module